jgi:hypothetical protein
MQLPKSVGKHCPTLQMELADAGEFDVLLDTANRDFPTVRSTPWRVSPRELTRVLGRAGFPRVARRWGRTSRIAAVPEQKGRRL